MIPFHPLADAFPLIEGPEFDALVADVRENGVRERIVLFERMILDGRNRYRAAVAAGLPRLEAEEALTREKRFGGGTFEQTSTLFRAFSPTIEGDPARFVVSLNIHRRHLTQAMRAMATVKLATLQPGRPSEWKKNPEHVPDSSHVEPLTQAEAAELLQVSDRSVRMARTVSEHGAPELADAVQRGEVALRPAAELSQLPVSEQLEILQGTPARDVGRVARERVKGSRAIMAYRREPDDSLDFFPTPPWATRALVMDVLPRLGGGLGGLTVWDPACGEGHMTGVLEEFVGDGHVLGTDIHDYSVGDVSPPGWAFARDFLGDEAVLKLRADWIVTNPPFGDKALPFADRALALARVGVALFVRQQWLEGVERYEKLFGVTPPTLVAQFAERVNLVKGRWDDEGTSATAYCWLVWVKPYPPRGPETRMVWIPPGRRKARTLAGDVERFTAHPVRAALVLRQAQDEGLRQAPTRDGVEAVLRARYGTVPNRQLADELGIEKVATMVTWAHRMGLTRHDRLGEMARERNAARAGGATV